MQVLRAASFSLGDCGHSDYHNVYWLHIGYWLILI